MFDLFLIYLTYTRIVYVIELCGYRCQMEPLENINTLIFRRNL